jgi:hypothetical protein
VASHATCGGGQRASAGTSPVRSAESIDPVRVHKEFKRAVPPRRYLQKPRRLQLERRRGTASAQASTSKTRGNVWIRTQQYVQDDEATRHRLFFARKQVKTLLTGDGLLGSKRQYTLEMKQPIAIQRPVHP